MRSTVAEAARLGIGGLLWRADFSLLAEEPHLPERLSEAAAAEGLGLVVEADVGSVPLPNNLVDQRPELFSLRRRHAGDRPIDPRQPFAPSGTALAKLASPDALALLLPRIQAACHALVDAGAQGLLLRGVDGLSPAALRDLVAAIHAKAPDLVLLARGSGFADGGLDGIILAAESGDAPIAAAAVPGAPPLLAEVVDTGDTITIAGFSSRLIGAAATADALVIPSTLLDRGKDVRGLVTRAVRLCGEAGQYRGETRLLTDAGAPIVAIARGDRPDMRQSMAALLTLFNADAQVQSPPDAATLVRFIGADFAPFAPADGGKGWHEPLQPGEVRLFRAERAVPIQIDAPTDIDAGAAADRLVIEDIRPSVEGGDFPVKRVVGETVVVEATLFGDGHEQLAAELWWRAADEVDWQRLRMEQHPNDQWQASFPLARLGRHVFRVEGWLDRFGGFRRDFTKKLQAEVAQPVDQAEGRALIEEALTRASDEVRAGLESVLAKLDEAPAGERGAALLLSPEVAALMDAADDRPHRIRSRVQLVDAERTAARFSSWYELFPRSQTDDAARHGTFADVIARLPAVRDMGFDTLYFPPIHPIGKTNRKGPNNTLTPGPDDVGSPYAIGAAEGGHDAIHPALGTFEDFKRLIEAAQAHGLEIALDFAIQCSPDHPWLREHHGWFAWRPDGSMKYAENPPKKYQDIVNVDFYGPDAVPGLWLALRDVILLWVENGVKPFRVDNPHTKPLPFWEWMIGDVQTGADRLYRRVDDDCAEGEIGRAHV